MIQTVQLPTPPTPPAPPVIVTQDFPWATPWWSSLPPYVTGVISVAFLAACAFVLYPVMRAIGRRIEGSARHEDSLLRAEVEQLRGRLAEVEVLQHRVVDLEERLDFAERMLAQGRAPERLPGL